MIALIFYDEEETVYKIESEIWVFSKRRCRTQYGDGHHHCLQRYGRGANENNKLIFLFRIIQFIIFPDGLKTKKCYLL